MKKSILKGMQAGLVILLLASCSKSANSGYGNNTDTNTTSTSNKISIANMAFAAASTSVAKGTTITWTNTDDMTHTVTADDNSFSSGNLNKGDTYAHTFNDAGTIAYHCEIHPGMKGNVIIK